MDKKLDIENMSAEELLAEIKKLEREMKKASKRLAGNIPQTDGVPVKV